MVLVRVLTEKYKISLETNPVVRNRGMWQKLFVTSIKHLLRILNRACNPLWFKDQGFSFRHCTSEERFLIVKCNFCLFGNILRGFVQQTWRFHISVNFSSSVGCWNTLSGQTIPTCSHLCHIVVKLLAVLHGCTIYS